MSKKKIMYRTQELDDKYKNDTFLKLWKNNFERNVTEGLLSTLKTKPAVYIKNTKIYQNKPVVLVAAGPSLDETIVKLKKYQDKVIIICADVSLQKLINEGVTPDFVVNLDAHEIIKHAWKDIDTSNLVLVAPTTAHPDALKEWKGYIFFYNQQDIKGSYKEELLSSLTKNIKGWGYIFNQYFVGATMYQFAYLFNPSIIMLMGYDFAFKGDKAYCGGVVENRVETNIYQTGTPEFENRLNEIHTAEQTATEVVEEKDINNVTVKTKKIYTRYKNILLSLINESKMPTVNCTEGGILTGIKSRPIEKIIEEFNFDPIKKQNPFTASIPKRKRRKKK